MDDPVFLSDLVRAVAQIEVLQARLDRAADTISRLRDKVSELELRLRG